MCIIGKTNPLLSYNLLCSNFHELTLTKQFLYCALVFQLISIIIISAAYLNSFSNHTYKNTTELATLDIRILGNLDTKRKNT